MVARRFLLVAAVMVGALRVIAPADAIGPPTATLVSIGPIGGGQATHATFVAASADGTRAFFITSERLVAGDTDTAVDVYMRSGSTTTLISTGPAGGNGPEGAVFGGISADGSRAFFMTGERLVASDTDSQTDVYERAGATTTLITPFSGDYGPLPAEFEGVSADGSRVIFSTRERLASTDTDTLEDIYQRFDGNTTQISTGPAGGNGLLASYFLDASSDGTRVLFYTQESIVAGDTDTRNDIYERVAATTNHVSIGPAGGNSDSSSHGASFNGASSDGTRVFFTTSEQLVSDDADAEGDIYERFGGTTTRLSTGPAGGNGDVHPYFRGASADGTRVFFDTAESLVPEDVGSADDVYQRSGSTTTLITPQPVAGGGASALFGGASADGTRVFYETAEQHTIGDTDARTDVYERFNGTSTLISTGTDDSSAGGGFLGSSADGKRVFFGAAARIEPEDTDTRTDIYERFGNTTTLISIGPSGGNGDFRPPTFLAASADGTRVYFHTEEALDPADADPADSDPTPPARGWQDVYVAGAGVTGGYPRPQSATPLRVPLVPAYEECTSPNTSHAAPLAFGSCNPPVPASDHLTVGTPDANGAPAKSSGFVKFTAMPGAPGGPDDADTAINVGVTDVRNQVGLTDYTGELRLATALRITDRASGTAASQAATMLDLPLSAVVPCSATGDATVGSTCSFSTTLDSLFGAGAVAEGKRAIHDIQGGIDLFDGGPDGDAGTPTGETLFVTDGYFIP
jgi:hypothetical protein